LAGTLYQQLPLLLRQSYSQPAAAVGYLKSPVPPVDE
jgi:hypothetical protein